MSIELKKCPFCGMHAIPYKYMLSLVCCASECCVAGEKGVKPDQWNTRFNDQPDGLTKLRNAISSEVKSELDVVDSNRRMAEKWRAEKNYSDMHHALELVRSQEYQADKYKVFLALLDEAEGCNPKRESGWVSPALKPQTVGLGEEKSVSMPLLFKTVIPDVGTHIRLGYYDGKREAFIESGHPDQTYKERVECWYQFQMPPITTSIEGETP
jgi:hypothetical protein